MIIGFMIMKTMWKKMMMGLFKLKVTDQGLYEKEFHLQIIINLKILHQQLEQVLPHQALMKLILYI